MGTGIAVHRLNFPKAWRLIGPHRVPGIGAGGGLDSASDSVSGEPAGVSVGKGVTVTFDLGLEGEFVVLDPAMLDVGIAPGGTESAAEFVALLLER